MTERALQNKCIRKAKALGWLAYKFASPANRGVPDVIFIYDGRVVFIEFKNPDGKGRLSALQKHTINLMRNNGAQVFVVDSEDHFNAIIS
jgi:hypothetical protein